MPSSTPHASTAQAIQRVRYNHLGRSWWILSSVSKLPKGYHLAYQLLQKELYTSEICDEAVNDYPDMYRRSYRPQTSPVVCRENFAGIEAAAIDTSISGVGGNIACRSLYEVFGE